MRKSTSLTFDARLAVTIKKYWTERGGVVNLHIEDQGQIHGNWVRGVRSDMVNGFPRHWLPKSG